MNTQPTIQIELPLFHLTPIPNHSSGVEGVQFDGRFRADKLYLPTASFRAFYGGRSIASKSVYLYGARYAFRYAVHARMSAISKQISDELIDLLFDDWWHKHQAAVKAFSIQD